MLDKVQVQEWWQHPVTKAHRSALLSRALREADVRNIAMNVPADQIGVEAIARRYVADALSSAYTESADELLEVLTEILTADSVEGGQDA